MSKPSLHSTLDYLFKNSSTALCNEECKQLILFESKQLPELTHGILEFTERPYSERVDLMVCVIQKEAAKLLAFIQSYKQWNSDWKTIRNFLQAWIDPDGILAQTLENIYLVFDNEAGRDPSKAPWVYLAFRKMFLIRDIYYALFIRSAALFPENLNPTIQQNLKLCLHEIQEPYWIFGYGLLHAREQNKMRLGICGFETIDQISDYLIRIGWKGNIPSFKEQCSFMNSFAESFVLAIDIGESTEKRIGIECVLHKEQNLVALGEALKELISRLDYDERRAEAILEMVHKKKIPEGKQILESWVNHIKLVFTAEEELEIKPYLYYTITTLN